MASIKKRPDGVWRARYRDEAGKEHARHFARKTDAQAWLDEVTASVVTGTYADPRAGRITTRAWLKEWGGRQSWVESTESGFDLVVRTIPFGDVPLKQLRPSHVEAWVKAMTAAGMAPNTVHNRVRPVKTAMRAAVRDRRIPVDPTEGVVLPRLRRREASMVIPTAEQVGMLIEACEPHRLPLLLFGAFAGLRMGEAAGAKVEDVNFLRREMRVQRQVQKTKGGGLVERLPKYGSERTVYLPDDVVTMLARHIEEIGVPSAGWFVMAASGGALPPTTMHAWFRSLCQRANVKGITFHTLRHFYASGLIADGCDVVTVQRAMGHRSAKVTLDTYSHLWPTAEDKTRTAAQHLLAAALRKAV